MDGQKNQLNLLTDCKRKRSNRLGVNGPKELQPYPWLRDIDWTALLN